MYSKWIAKITPENIDDLVEYCAMFSALTREYITQEMETNAAKGEDSYLLVYNPENRTAAAFYVVDATEVKERYILIPIFHPQGHLQEFVVND